jgi:GT2 family glycosyltransferase
MSSRDPTLTVIIVTWRRPHYVQEGLAALQRMEGLDPEVIVVDASDDEETEQVVARFSLVKYLSFPRGAGHMTKARNAGLLYAGGDIVAFLDDDAWVRPGWADAVRAVYRDPVVSAAVGRTCNGESGEERAGVDRIGQFRSDGQLTGNFAADPGEIVPVQHGIGANMSFRREVLAELGGFRDDFRGVGGVREDTDVFLRVRALGRTAVFVPDAVVDHVGAPHASGKRFDWRYAFWARYNHVLLLTRNCGLASGVTWRWLRHEIFSQRDTDAGGHPAKIAARRMLCVSAVGVGVIVSLAKASPGPQDPRRQSRAGQMITAALSSRTEIVGSHEGVGSPKP